MSSCRAVVLVALCWLAGLGNAIANTAGTDAPVPAACDARDSATVLHPAARTATDARAYWLDRRLLKWPQASGDGRFALYHSAGARLVADKGARVSGADGALALDEFRGELPGAVAERFRFVGDGAVLAIRDDDLAKLPNLLTQQVLLVHEDRAGRALDATAVQLPGVLDDLYAAAEAATDLGVGVGHGEARFKLWAPTARAVSLCVYDSGDGAAKRLGAMQRDDATGTWSLPLPRDLSGGYYTYLVDVFVPDVGVVRNRVTDPYSISLTTDSRRSYIADLDDQALEPTGWDTAPRPAPLASQTDMTIYELHVRDFSIDDVLVSAANRGKYLAFTETGSNGMRHLRALADAGLTDVHLLPVFDIASVPEAGCVIAQVPQAAPDSETQQAAVMAVAAKDCFNWGYDPYHFNAPEGSYASDAADGTVRVREFRAMVMALHAAGLRVGMDVVYNHTTASGQREQSVLDRIVPGYYHRLDANGTVERSTCCDNTATEHRMMGKLMIDSAASWAKHYRIDSFRFDLMGHQPRAAMEQLQGRVDAAAGRHVNLIGEGWNFGEVADGARFVQASQRSLEGSGIGTFSDRARDAIRGGGPGDHGTALVAEQGYLNGLVYDRNASADPQRPRSDLLHAADLVRVGLAGTLRDYRMPASDGTEKSLSQIDYKGQPAGYASQPGEVVNYVENHDNQTLFDIDALKLPRGTSREDRARVQMLGVALTAFSQGVAYFHAGIDTLRSKSMDRNSFDSGDWFNRLDWSYADNHFGSGLPPANDNREDWPLMRPLLADADIAPTPREIAFARDAFRDLLRIRASSTLFRLRAADDIKQRLRFHNTGPAQNPVVIAGHLDGAGYPGAGFAEILYLVNVDKRAQTLVLPAERGKAYVLHPVQQNRDAADPRPRDAARYKAGTGRFVVPARTAVVYVVE
ncbi:MAG: alpha-1,6-glucosidase domain-containing protein [Luteimonas sp.]